MKIKELFLFAFVFSFKYDQKKTMESINYNYQTLISLKLREIVNLKKWITTLRCDDCSISSI